MHETFHPGGADHLSVSQVARCRCLESVFRRSLQGALHISTLVAPSNQAIGASLVVELACSALRLPLLNYLSWHVFFGRGSFPDVDPGCELGRPTTEIP